MRTMITAVFLLVSSGMAIAQTPTQLTPSQLAIQVDNGVNALAAAMENAQKQIGELSQENAKLKKELADAEAKLKALPAK